MTFLAQWFAIAGLVAAAGPILIHLLNRQRFRVVEWAAMDFLRQAVRRSRRILRLRDLLLLLLRTLCVLAFGLAMARPYLAASAATFKPDQPVHAVLIVDNSLSMSVEQLNKPLLDEAKKQAKDFIGRLPPGSRVSVLPLCGSTTEYNLGAYGTREDALEALAAIQPVDRAGTAALAIDLAMDACRRVPSPSAKQVVFISDQQAANWPSQSLDSHLKQLRTPMQVVQVAPKELVENAWIADFRLQDGIADPSTPSVFLATIRCEGSKPRYDVQVTLSVEGVTVATQSIELQPGQAREVRFPPYQFDITPEPGKPTFVAAEVSIPHDAVAGDDQRFLMVPVVAALPVVFVDQYGPDEDPQRNRFGETFRLRRVLAPVTERNQPEHQLVQVVHKRIDQVDQELLSGARLVVIAGVANPEGRVPLLRQYVEQGGRLVIAAGGDFDPAAWNEAAWLDGQGILPAPLKPTPVGRLPGTSAGPINAFQLDFSSMVHDYFLIEQTSREELEDFYRLPYFFMAVEADAGEDVLGRMSQKVVEQIEKNRNSLAEVNQRLTELTERELKGIASEADRQERARLEQTQTGLKPQWLLWAAGQQTKDDDSLPVEKVAERTRPRVLARFTNKLPYLIERDIGNGQVLLVTSGVYRDWNTLTATNTVVIFDRILHDMLHRTLPKRNLSTTEPLVVPVPAGEHRARFTLTDPAQKETSLAVDAMGANRYGIGLTNLPLRGIYRVTARGTKEMSQAAADTKLWEIALAVNGPAEESDLRTLDEAALQERMGPSDYRWVAQGQSIQLSATPLQGQDLWEWLMIGVVTALLLEMAVLALPSLGKEQTA